MERRGRSKAWLENTFTINTTNPTFDKTTNQLTIESKQKPSSSSEKMQTFRFSYRQNIKPTTLLLNKRTHLPKKYTTKRTRMNESKSSFFFIPQNILKLSRAMPFSFSFQHEKGREKAKLYDKHRKLVGIFRKKMV